MTLQSILTPDLVNGSFEFLGALSIGNNIRQLLKDKMVKGVSLWSTCFFTSWGLWNLYYYPHLDQMLSFAGGVALCGTNVTWLILARKYWKATTVPVEPVVITPVTVPTIPEVPAAPVVMDFDAVCDALDQQAGVNTEIDNPT